MENGYKVQELIFDLLDLRRADIIAQGRGQHPRQVDRFEKRIREEIAKKPPFSVRDLDIDGHKLMSEFHLTPGPLIGDILNHLLELVLDEPELNKNDILLQKTKDFLESQ